MLIRVVRGSPAFVALIVVALGAAAVCSTLGAQTPPAATDSATLFREARRLTARADTLELGSAADRREAVNLLHNAATSYASAGAHANEAATIGNIGHIFAGIGEPDSALAYHRRALSLMRAVGDRRGEAITLGNIGYVFANIGQLDSALAYQRQALPIRRAVQDRLGEAITLSNIGSDFADIGQPDSALAYHRQALPIRRAVGDRHGEAVTLGNIGFVLSSIGQPDSALAYYRQALPIKRAVGDRSGEASTLGNIGAVFSDIGNPDSALTYYRESLPIRRAVGDRSGEATTLGNMGTVFLHIGRPDSALAYHRQALPIERAVRDRHGEATTLSNIGTVFAGIGKPDSALAFFRQALPIRHAIGDRAGEATTLGNIGVIYSEIGQPDSALAYDRQALPIRRAVGDRSGEATTLSNIGTVFSSLGLPDSAIAYFCASLPIERTVGDRPGEASTLGNIGSVFESLGRPDSALAYHRRALSIKRAIGNRSGEATTLGNIGAGFGTIGRPDSALAYYRQALPIWRGVGDRAGEAVTLDNIGFAFASIGRPDSALVYYRNALPIERAVRDRAGEANTLIHLAVDYRRSGRLDSALVLLEQATTVLAGIAKHAGSDVNHTAFDETSVSVYDLWTLTWLATARRGDSLATARAAYGALAASERGRAQAMAQLMGASRELKPGTDMVAEGKSIAQRLVRTSTAALVYATTRDTLVTWLVRPGGAIVVAEQALHSTALDTLVAAMRFGVATGDATPNRGRGEVMDPVTLPSPVRDRALADSGRTLRTALATLLLPPAIRAQLPVGGDLLIIPQGQLGLIPFGLLPVASDTLLGSRFALRYAPSLSASIAAEDRAGSGTAIASDRAKQFTPALVVGDPAMPAPFRLDGHAYALGDLPSARDEGHAVADSLGAAGWLTGTAASETAVRTQLPDARLVHLATHGIVFTSDAHARLSFIALAPDAAHDGRLSVGTILDSLSLQAELVVLSACQTGVGDIKAAEGTLGLQRAMLAKGARSVLVSLWNVSDESTLFLIQRFYHHWLHDAPAVNKSEALRRAQGDVQIEARNALHLDHRVWSDPFYWAAFQVVGAP